MEEEQKFGIYFDDDYNYLQHLRDANKDDVEWVETPSNLKVNHSKNLIKLKKNHLLTFI